MSNCLINPRMAIFIFLTVSAAVGIACLLGYHGPTFVHLVTNFMKSLYNLVFLHQIHISNALYSSEPNDDSIKICVTQIKTGMI